MIQYNLYVLLRIGFLSDVWIFFPSGRRRDAHARKRWSCPLTSSSARGRLKNHARRRLGCCPLEQLAASTSTKDDKTATMEDDEYDNLLRSGVQSVTKAVANRPLSMLEASTFNEIDFHLRMVVYNGGSTRGILMAHWGAAQVSWLLREGTRLF